MHFEMTPLIVAGVQSVRLLDRRSGSRSRSSYGKIRGLICPQHLDDRAICSDHLQADRRCRLYIRKEVVAIEFVRRMKKAGDTTCLAESSPTEGGLNVIGSLESMGNADLLSRLYTHRPRRGSHWKRTTCLVHRQGPFGRTGWMHGVRQRFVHGFKVGRSEELKGVVCLPPDLTEEEAIALFVRTMRTIGKSSPVADEQADAVLAAVLGMAFRCA